MRIAVFGSTGGTGLSLLEQAGQRGYQVVDNPETGRYKIGTVLNTGLSSSIARAALATALLDQLENNEFIGKCSR